MKNRLFQLAILITVSLTAFSCKHKELCYDHAHKSNVRVIFDWKCSPTAQPKSVSLYLFPVNGGEALRYEFTERTGGIIRVPVGYYDALCINSDTENISCRNTDKREKYEATTRATTLLLSLSPLGVRSEGAPRSNSEERIALPPDNIWTDNAVGITISDTQKDVANVITLCPKWSVCSYTVEIRNAANLKYVKGMSASLSTLAGGMMPGIGADALTEECVTVPFELTMNKDSATVKGGLLTFGHCPIVQRKHTLTVYAILSDNKKWYYTFDVTAQIHSAADKRNVHIILNELPLPKPITNGGGFKPVVNEWQTVEIDITM